MRSNCCKAPVSGVSRVDFRLASQASHALRSCLKWLSVVCAASCMLFQSEAASITSSGYTNDFTGQPPAADWSTLSIAGGSGDITDAAGLDTAVQALTAFSISVQTVSDAGNPPAANGSATWSSTGAYLQTRPTSVRANVLMCTLVNNLGTSASSVSVGYTLSATILDEEVDGHRAFYSLTGAANSWTNIPAFTTATPGALSVTLNVTVTNGGTLYLLWADDNGSPGPDEGWRIDNFFASATPSMPVPITITKQPTNLTVISGQSASFTVAANGIPISYQWFRNVTKITGATTPTFTINPTTNGSAGQYFCVLSNQLSGNVTSSVATLTVLVDNIPPTVVSAVSPTTRTSISVTFSENVTSATASRSTNYVITLSGTTNRLNITGVSVVNFTTVTLGTVARLPGAAYTLTINNIRDLANNVIAPNTQIPVAIEDTNLLMSASWRIDASGNNLGTSWRAYDYDDSSWTVAAGAFDAKDGAPRAAVGGQTVGTQLPLNTVGPPYDTSRIPTYYFRTHFNWPGYTNGAFLRLRHLLDDGAVFYLNGVEFYRFEVFDPVVFGYNGATAVGDAATSGFITNFVNSLRPGDNVLAVELHQINATSSDITFGADLIGHVEAIPFGPVTVTNQPTMLTVVESQPAEFSVELNGTLPYRFQWFSNNVAVAGATNRFFTIPITSLAVSGKVFRVNITNVFTNATFYTISSNILLKVIPDTERPVLVQAYLNATFDAILVSYSERVSAVTATNVNLYRVTNTMNQIFIPTTATLMDGTNVLITFGAPLSPSDRYTLRVNGVKDISVAGNTVLTNSGVTVGGAFNFLPFDALWDYYQLGNDLGTGWRTNGFPPEGLQQGFALLGLEDNPGSLPFFGSPNTGLLGIGQTTYYFLNTFQFSGSSAGVQLQLRHITDDGVVIYLNNKEIYRFNMPAGPVTYFTTAATVNTASLIGPITLPGTNLINGANVIAAELHQNNASADNDSAFAIELNGFIQSAQLTDYIPHLNFSRSNTVLRLNWTAPGYNLQQSTTVTGVWSNVGSGIITNSGLINYSTNLSNSTRFFRLR